MLNVAPFYSARQRLHQFVRFALGNKYQQAKRQNLTIALGYSLLMIFLIFHSSWKLNVA